MEKIDYEDAVLKYGSGRAASKALGIPETTFRRRLKKQTRRQDLSSLLNKYKIKHTDPEEILPTNEYIKNQTIHLDADGNVKNRWMKTDQRVENAAEYLKALAETLSTDITPRDPVPLHPSREYIEELASVYTMSDFHMGMYANMQETGDVWNMDRAKQVFKDFIYHASQQTQNSAQAILLNLGDMSHTDGNTPHTTSRNHAIDVSGRFNEIRDALVECFDYAIMQLLRTHKRVHVIYARGNHDSYTAPLIRDMIARAYANNLRVTFDRTDGYYHSFQWGQTALFAHHGHKRTMKQLAETFTTKFSKIYGECKFRYGFFGHRHHEKIIGDELFGIKMRQFETLAPLDAYAAEGGYAPSCRTSVMVFHKKFGYRGEHSITLDELSID